MRCDAQSASPTTITSTGWQDATRGQVATSIATLLPTPLPRELTRLSAQVNVHDEDDEPETPIATAPRHQPIPNSPPPSFHSRASSRELARRGQVDPTLADAFDTEGDDSDDDADDRQRLVRGNSFPSDDGQATPVSSAASIPGAPVERNATQFPPRVVSGRVYGGGIQSDGVFSNLTAKPERAQPEKEEQPPVRFLVAARMTLTTAILILAL